MPAGLLAGTSTTTLLVANVTGRVQRPAREQRLRLLRARGGEHVRRRAVLDLALQHVRAGEVVGRRRRRSPGTPRAARPRRRRSARPAPRRAARAARREGGQGSVVAWGSPGSRSGHGGSGRASAGRLEVERAAQARERAGLAAQRAERVEVLVSLTSSWPSSRRVPGRLACTAGDTREVIVSWISSASASARACVANARLGSLTAKSSSVGASSPSTAFSAAR